MIQIKKGRRIIKSPRMIKMEVRNFFKKLYKQKQMPEFQFQQGLVDRISDQQAEELEMLPTKEEIRNAVWDCESSKAPGPDGFNFNFIKRCWKFIGIDFVKCVEDFFHEGSLPRNANMTWVTLAPKRMML